MRIIDELGGNVTDPDLTLGKLIPERILIERHAAQSEQERIEEPDESNVIEEFFNEDGVSIGKTIGFKVVQEYRPASAAWDEYEDVMRYVLYTSDELAAMAAAKAAEEEARLKAEEEAAAAKALEDQRNAIVDGAPARFDAVEAVDLDHDEAITGLYASTMQAQLDTDEALVTLYEMIAAPAAPQA